MRTFRCAQCGRRYARPRTLQEYCSKACHLLALALRRRGLEVRAADYAGVADVVIYDGAGVLVARMSAAEFAARHRRRELTASRARIHVLVSGFTRRRS